MPDLRDKIPFLDKLPFRRKPAEPATVLEALRQGARAAVLKLGDTAAEAVQAALRRAPDAAETVVPKAPDAVEASLRAVGRSRKAQVAPAVLLITGAGVAFWWWTQWARGRAESEAAADPKEK